MELGEALLAFVALELSPEFELLVDYFECLRVVSRQFDFLPELFWQVGAFDGLHIQVADALFLEHSCITGVCKRTRMTRTQACQIVFISAERLSHSPTI